MTSQEKLKLAMEIVYPNQFLFDLAGQCESACAPDEVQFWASQSEKTILDEHSKIHGKT